MTCRDFIEFLMDYLAGDLSPEERALFDAHLAMCPACRAYLQTYQETIQLEKALLEPTEEAVPADVPDQLIQAILAARTQGG